MTDIDTIDVAASARRALKKAGQKYARAQAARDAAMDELTEAMKVADAVGVPRLQIKNLAGVARATVYTVLDK